MCRSILNPLDISLILTVLILAGVAVLIYIEDLREARR